MEVELGRDGSTAFSEADVSRGVFAAEVASLDRRGGVRILPSALCWFKVGEEAGPLLRCLLEGIPLAEARSLAIAEPASRDGRCAAGKLWDWGRYGEAS